MSAWQASLEEDIGVDEAAVVVDRVDRSVGERHLDHKLDELVGQFERRLEAVRHELVGAWRRDLLVIAVPQFVALTAILLGVGH